ncbi:MAG: aldehyde dehydrogenase family protein [Chloroflexi bacterium]|nr:aldehyde dehydrogenase family protein [Chloroflexota bacterium]
MTTQEVRLPLKARIIINGEEGDASNGKEFARENPANFRETVTLAAEGTLEDVRAAIDAARTVFDSNKHNWVSDYKLRERVLYQTAQLIRRNAPRLAKVVSLEVGMPMRQAMPHIGAAADVFEFYAGFCSKLYGQAMVLANGSMINLIKEPVGVVGVITPWNFPLTQTARKVAPALAVGCTIIAKPASYTPASTYELVKLMHEAGMPPGVVNCVPGPGRSVGNELVESHKIDKVSFTGETRTGMNILQRAAMDMKRVSLELGGKNPFVMFADANIEAASRSLVFGMYRNAGQACGSTARLLVQEAVHGPFLKRVTELTRALRVGQPASQDTDMGPMISKSQEEMVLEYIKFGQDAGFRLVTGGQKLNGTGYDGGYFIEPTIFDGVDNSSKLAQEEIFGPVLTVTPFKDDAEAIELANAVSYGLTAAVWSGDTARSLRVARAIRAGTVWVNDAYTQPPEGIWGGFKQSGMGRELGPYGIDDFVEVKQIYTDGTGLTTKPPYLQVLRD